MLAFGLDKKIVRPMVWNKLIARTRLRIGNASRINKAGPVTSSSFMGLLTPFLPCGPLYLLFGVALLSGSALKGAELALAFGLGTVPLLWLAQHSFHKWRARLKPTTMVRLQRSLALLTAIIMAWRLQDTIPAFSRKSESATETKELPSCCHEAK
jgi:sulfite exporter TauE/SafE